MKFIIGLIIGMFLPFMLAGAWAGATAWSFVFFKDHFGLFLLGIILVPLFLMITGGKKKKKFKNNSFSK